MKKHTICAVTGSRADYGPLKELLRRLQNNEAIKLDLLVTGSHLETDFGGTEAEIQKDGFSNYIKISIPMESDTKHGMAEATGTALIRFSRYFSAHRPELLVLLGDRYEILAAAIAAQMSAIPIAHISGGDITEGAVDDAIRHSITKMSQLHFPGCGQSARRIIQMGEQPDTVWNVGELGVENCLKTNFLGREKLAGSLGFPGMMGDYSVVTYHPVTMEDNMGVGQVKELIRAMDKIEGMAYIITMANADAGGRAINELWFKESRARANWHVAASLGVTRYLSALKYAKLVVGNSSSGIIEAPAIGVPTVNIGDRQKGRMMSESVICCGASQEQIAGAMAKALGEDFQEKARHVVNPFGDGHTSQLIEKKIIEFLNGAKSTAKKRFYDIAFRIN